MGTYSLVASSVNMTSALMEQGQLHSPFEIGFKAYQAWYKGHSGSRVFGYKPMRLWQCGLFWTEGVVRYECEVSGMVEEGIIALNWHISNWIWIDMSGQHTQNPSHGGHSLLYYTILVHVLRRNPSPRRLTWSSSLQQTVGHPEMDRVKDHGLEVSTHFFMTYLLTWEMMR